MPHFGFVGEGEELGIGLGSGQRGDGQRCHEFGATPGEDDAELDPALAPAPDDVQRLIGGNAAGDDEENSLSGAHIGSFHSKL